MMKGVFCVKNGRGQIKGYYPSQNLDADKAYYDNKEYKKEKWWARASKNNPHASLNFEVIEVTDNPEYEFLKYVLPQIARITYDQELINGIVNGRYKVSRLQKATEIFCESYPTQHYSIHFYANEKGRICGVLNRKGSELCHLRFSKKDATTIVAEDEEINDDDQEN